MHVCRLLSNQCLWLPHTVSPIVGTGKVKARNARVNTRYPHIALPIPGGRPVPLLGFFLLGEPSVCPAASQAQLKSAPTVGSCCCLQQDDLLALSSHCPLTLGMVLCVGKRQVDQTRWWHLNILFGPAGILLAFVTFKLNISHKPLVPMNPWLLACLEKLVFG